MQQIVLKGGILSAINICKLSPRHSDFSAVRPCRSLHEELQRRQHLQLPFGSMTSFAKYLLNAEQLHQAKTSRGDCGNKIRSYRFGKDSNYNSLKVLLKKKHKHTGAKDNERTYRISRYNGKLLDLIENDDYIGLKDRK